ncbi:hypothetical protein BGW36DRAFT_445863 [Talaromyces proteolyticus]|uniref:Metallo-beta-lactamase domain-containing protein n=1 Tax=Talaromyces proteolyticus TaxID=1131652 RepID=A0AAD4L180_9EURO|nr:uncharacterized protein BGW36DRAFT_445863 [Talaromyces proteolyticus]KAH8702266.1 hypothetical protein BGW36DRAFT_445863 [Talaromyces proteolyticus]
MTDPWRVESYHVAVSIGDAAIHLLVNEPAAGKATVERACLIDGGETDGLQPLSLTIRWIERHHSLENLQFDSVVVTHWDSDHYKGVVALINDDLEKQFEDLKKKYDPVPADKVAELKCKYFKYDKSSKCLTTFYAPYWDGFARKDFGGGWTSAVVLESEGDDPKEKKPVKAQDRPDNLTENTDDPKNRLLNFGLMKNSTGKLMYDSSGKPYFANGICKLRYTPIELIGVNFFNNINGFNETSKYQDAKDRAALVGQVDWKEAPVGVVCLASLNGCIGDSDPTFQIGKKKALGDPSFDKPPPPDVVNDKKCSKNNWASICAIVIWQNQNVSHYFAGDAPWFIENRLAKWLNTTVPKMKLR